MDDGNKILIYTTKLGHPSMARITNDIVQGFAQLGLELISADINDVSTMREARHLLLNGQIDFSVGVNNTGKCMVDDDGRCVYEYIDTPFVSIMLDAPYNVATDNIAFSCRNHYVCLLDKTHQEALKICYPKTDFAGSMLLPLGGSSNGNEEAIFSNDRPLDVVYSASIYHGGDFLPIWMENDTSPFIVALLKDVVDYMMTNPVSMLDAFDVVLKTRGLYGPEYIHKFTPYMFALFFYVKHRRRYNAVEALVKEGITVDVYGSGWDWTPFVDKLRYHGEVDFEEVLDAFTKAKVVFQDQAEFNNGGHDRVFTAMLNGAVVVSEYSTYLEQKFDVNKDIFLFDWQNTSSQLQIIKELINNETMRLSVAISAYGKASNQHRWVNRAASIMEMMSVLRGN